MPWILKLTNQKVSFLLKILDEKKSVGPDGLSTRKVSNEIADPLTKLYNKFLQTAAGVFPTDWKRCNMTPVYKGGQVIFLEISNQYLELH